MSCSTSAASGANLYVGVHGIKFGFTITDASPGALPGTPLDVSIASGLTVTIRFQRPDTFTVDEAAVFSDFPGATGDGTDGRVMVLISDSDFFSQAGTWSTQAIVTGTGVEYKSAINAFPVGRGL